MASNLPIFPIEDYQLEDNLGQGAFGIVSLYQKKISHSVSSSDSPGQVAVKMFQLRDLKNYDTELKIMTKIGKTTTNIVKFYGACTLSKGKVGLVMELFDTDLMNYIEPPCSLRKAKLILGQAAMGLKSLRDLNIVHRDIKPENILVKINQNGEIKVALTDLGIAKHMTATRRSRQTNIGTDLWMAPEVTGDSPTYGHPTDVYGYGLTGLYILTGNFPQGKDVKQNELSQWLDQCLQDQDAMLSDLIKACLEFDPSKRISKSALIQHNVFNAKITDGVDMTSKEKMLHQETAERATKSVSLENLQQQVEVVAEPSPAPTFGAEDHAHVVDLWEGNSNHGVCMARLEPGLVDQLQRRAWLNINCESALTSELRRRSSEMSRIVANVAQAVKKPSGAINLSTTTTFGAEGIFVSDHHHPQHQPVG